MRTSINGRLAMIEFVLSSGDEEAPQGVPEEWLERDGDGRLIGPPPDARPAQRRTFEEVAAMLDSVPFCE
jgi:hypothetical protein